jgi:hypothetical protein
MRNDRLSWATTWPLESRWLPTVAMVEAHSEATRREMRRHTPSIINRRTAPVRIAHRQRAARAWLWAMAAGFVVGAGSAAVLAGLLSP